MSLVCRVFQVLQKLSWQFVIGWNWDNVKILTSQDAPMSCPNNDNFIKHSGLYQMCWRFDNNYKLTCYYIIHMWLVVPSRNCKMKFPIIHLQMLFMSQQRFSNLGKFYLLMLLLASQRQSVDYPFSVTAVWTSSTKPDLITSTLGAH